MFKPVKLSEIADFEILYADPESIDGAHELIDKMNDADLLRMRALREKGGPQGGFFDASEILGMWWIDRLVHPNDLSGLERFENYNNIVFSVCNGFDLSSTNVVVLPTSGKEGVALAFTVTPKESTDYEKLELNRQELGRMAEERNRYKLLCERVSIEDMLPSQYTTGKDGIDMYCRVDIIDSECDTERHGKDGMHFVSNINVLYFLKAISSRDTGSGVLLADRILGDILNFKWIKTADITNYYSIKYDSRYDLWSEKLSSISGSLPRQRSVLFAIEANDIGFNACRFILKITPYHGVSIHDIIEIE